MKNKDISGMEEALKKIEQLENKNKEIDLKIERLMDLILMSEKGCQIIQKYDS